MSEGRDIYCYKCGTFLGTIRDARLKVGILHICSGCAAVKKRDPEVDMLRKMFGV